MPAIKVTGRQKASWSSTYRREEAGLRRRASHSFAAPESMTSSPPSPGLGVAAAGAASTAAVAIDPRYRIIFRIAN